MSAMHIWKPGNITVQNVASYTMANGMRVVVQTGLSSAHVKHKVITVPCFRDLQIRFFNKRTQFAYVYTDNASHERMYLGGFASVPYLAELVYFFNHELLSARRPLLLLLPEHARVWNAKHKDSFQQWGVCFYQKVADSLETIARYSNFALDQDTYVTKDEIVYTNFGYAVSGDYYIVKQERNIRVVYMQGVLSIPETAYSLDLRDAVYMVIPMPHMLRVHEVSCF